MDPDIPDNLVSECAPNDAGQLYCDGWRVLDARASISDRYPDVVQKIRILDLSPEIPNDTISFSSEFPDDLKQVVMHGLVTFLGTEECAQSLCNEKFYDWTSASPIYDTNFDGVRLLVKYFHITLDNLEDWD